MGRLSCLVLRIVVLTCHYIALYGLRVENVQGMYVAHTVLAELPNDIK
jgi:hypothetical protein